MGLQQCPRDTDILGHRNVSYVHHHGSWYAVHLYGVVLAGASEHRGLQGRHEGSEARKAISEDHIQSKMAGFSGGAAHQSPHASFGNATLEREEDTSVDKEQQVYAVDPTPRLSRSECFEHAAICEARC